MIKPPIGRRGRVVFTYALAKREATLVHIDYFDYFCHSSAMHIHRRGGTVYDVLNMCVRLKEYEIKQFGKAKGELP